MTENRDVNVSTKTRIKLLRLSANRCNLPDCRRELFIEEPGVDDPSLIGEVCHIVARKPNHARGDSPLTPNERAQYSNLILLCRNHHKMVDDMPEKYTAEVLHEMKQVHEQWVRDSLSGYDPANQRDDEVYAAYVDEWTNRVELDRWPEWSASLMGSGQPSLPKDKERSLAETGTWIFGRVWPGRCPELEASFENFCWVLRDLLQVFRSHVEERGDELWTRKFYRIDEWDPERYDRLSRQFDFHVDLVEDLTLEFTRAANYVCDRVREFLDPTFRIDEGLVTAQSGPYLDGWRRHRVQYREEEQIFVPYRGLENFKVERKSRDAHFGEGTGIDDPNCKIAG